MHTRVVNPPNIQISAKVRTNHANIHKKCFGLVRLCRHPPAQRRAPEKYSEYSGEAQMRFLALPGYLVDRFTRPNLSGNAGVTRRGSPRAIYLRARSLFVARTAPDHPATRSSRRSSLNG